MKGERVFLVIIALLSAFLVFLGMILDPDPSGVGTHCQLGLPPCDFLIRTGKPCITCGATTAFSLAAHGRILSAFETQPLGATLFFICLLAIFLCVKSIVTGNSLFLRISLLPWATIIILFIAFALLSWIYKLVTWNPK